MNKRLRLAVAGTGAFGREHLKTLARIADIEIAAVADLNIAAAQEVAAQYGVQQVETDAMELIAHAKPDGLIVTTPGETHVPIALEALKLGIPVLLEKPVGLTAAEVEKLRSAEASGPAFVLPGHVLRFSDHHRMLYDIAHSPEVGPILAFGSRRHRDESHVSRYAEVDPVLMTMVHDIDLALWFTGTAADEVYALRYPPGTPRSTTMMLAHDPKAGVAWHLSTAWTFPGSETPPDRVEIIGENGGVELEAGAYIRQYGQRTLRIDLSVSAAEDPLASELIYFSQCIRTGSRPSVVTMSNAYAGLTICEAILKSLKTGRTVRL
jgi:predicted dehydrogenase